MRGKNKRRLKDLEEAYDKVLSEKLELEYKCRELEQEYTHEKTQRDDILSIHENARKLKHDMKNHIMVITAYLQENDVDHAKEYLSKIIDKLNGMYTYIETGNSLMSHVLNQKLETAHKRGIHVKAQIENLSFEQMESVDFVSMLTNLMDNAIEGAESGEGRESSIYVCIERRRGYETVLVKNSISKSVLETNPKFESTKPEGNNHGYGIRQIRQIAKKYDGLCRFFEEDGMFCAAVMIPA